MDYMTKPLSRIAIRHLSKYVRKIFELNESELFPVLEILEQTCIIFEGTEYSVLEDINCLLMYLPGAILSLKVDL